MWLHPLALSSNGFDWVGALESPRPEPKARAQGRVSFLLRSNRRGCDVLSNRLRAHGAPGVANRNRLWPGPELSRERSLELP